MTTASDTIDVAAIEQCEERLRLAMLAGDVEALKKLLAEDLTFIDHQGRRVDKAADLEIYRNGVLEFMNIEVLDRVIKPLDNVALVSLRARVTGTYYGEKFSEKLAYTRVWSRKSNAWTVISVHCSRITM
ncbi:nuclear transport factor 2 family protein [Phyllobacterium myrsinacearum]|uniref:Ketosteroid isomerase-like protein n=1 Tax=Phyllobacterium myrsinacearum TaxID=28101 RepID=A0A839ESB2_9HYPH|nr:nuclear transport factor 2 family protein [Phyllobacterium myrsinacearum]MBA8879500.1 ketosteroid isomerase-like protein [Phyllobacterium myrsinacearum]